MSQKISKKLSQREFLCNCLVDRQFNSRRLSKTGKMSRQHYQYECLSFNFQEATP